MSDLLVQLGADAGRIFPLTKETTTIGRHSENDIALNDATASRFHAQIFCDSQNCRIRDLNSTHGTFVNNRRAEPELELAPNDLIRIGATEMRFRSGVENDRVGLLQFAPSDGPYLDERSIAFSLPITVRSRDTLSNRHLERLASVAVSTPVGLRSRTNCWAPSWTCCSIIFKPDRGVILLLDETTGDLIPRVKRPRHENQPISVTILKKAIDGHIALLISDIAGDERFNAAESILAQSILAAICCPLVCRDKVLGVLYIDTKSHLLTYRKEDLTLLNIIAANAAIAIDDALLVQQKLEAERLAAAGLAVANISHYIKNLLTGISGSSQLIEMGIESQNLKVIQEAWPILKRANDRIASLVRDMLTYSRKRDPELEEGNLNDLLRDVCESQASRAQLAHCQIVQELADDLPRSCFDPRGLHDTLLNLVGNAIEACEALPDGRIILRSGYNAQTDNLWVWISDNGPGIPENIRKRILDPFFSTKGARGTGLGLAIARKTLEEHGGHLTVDSETAQGATFKIRLPRIGKPIPPCS
jgi:signal transduction histidine kinase/pSer/pThr/pTyr-binding forkhead associated (FHA) protein